MRTLFGFLVISFVLILTGSFVWTHVRRSADKMSLPVQTEATSTEPQYAEAQNAQKMVTVTGPLADYMAGQDGQKVETLQLAPYKAVPSDHVGGSVVGSSTPLLHQTFGIRNAVDLPFEVPAHATNPQLRGTYSSASKRAASKKAGDGVDLLLLNEKQFSDFLNGHAGEATFSAEDASEQEVNANLPPTFGQPQKYHLIFRNASRETGNKVVQADFRIDY